jgi:hypothetical protein
MKTISSFLAGTVVVLFAFATSATTHYVDLNCANATPPYTGWSTAATNIQDAIDASTNGDWVLVTNGIYQTGGRAVYGTSSNRIVLDKALTVQSINGAASTMVVGACTAPTHGGPNVRCAYLTNGAVLIGFTLTKGGTPPVLEDLVREASGGGVWCEDTSASILNCVLVGNTSGYGGGAAYSGTLTSCVLASNTVAGGRGWGGGAWASTLNNCVLLRNSGYEGGGANSGWLYNCLIVGNSAGFGGGTFSSTLNNCTIVSNTATYSGGGISGGAADDFSTNCIIYYNSAPSGTNWNVANIANGCTVPLPVGSGNITNEPLFVSLPISDFHLQSSSPCINAGNSLIVSSVTDLDGKPRIVGGTVDIGAYENQGNIRYVSPSSTSPIPPYSDWSVAATNIQDAVDTANPGDLVLVTNGVYATGGRSWYGSGTNRVTLTNTVTLKSVNGPTMTMIVGNRVTGTGPVLTNAARCVAMGNNAVLSGFTLTNGEAGWGNNLNGGGVSQVSSISAAGTVTNCVLINNLSTNGVGGGAFRVRLADCQIIGNYAVDGGGACACTLINCTVVSNTAPSGGGVYGSTAFGASVLGNCTVAGNFATSSGGGAYGSTLNNCILSENSSDQYGGGASGGTLIACIVSNNFASAGGGACGSILCNSLVVSNSAAAGGGLFGGIITNCTVVSNSATNSGGGINGGSGSWCYNSIIFYNNAPAGSNNIGAKFYNCCTIPDSFDSGITNEPLFVNPAAGDFHLQSGSPCINSGKDIYVSSPTDLDGNPRTRGGTVDIGAYEYQTPSSILSYAWAQMYGFPTDGSADFVDTDGDGMNNWQEWRAGTVPTNAASRLAMDLLATNSVGLQISWQSVSGTTYYLQRSSDLSAPSAFSSIRSNLIGQTGTTVYTDTTATNGGPYFYRIGVQ